MENTGKKELTKDFIWNTVGSLVYALSSMVLAVVAMRFLGPDDGGIFGFGFSTLGQQMFLVAYFGIRPFHITDTKRQYSFEDYKRLRILTCLAAVMIGIIWLMIMFVMGRYDVRKCAIMVLLICYKVCDGAADLYESECQRIDRLYIGGIELTFRTLFAGGVLAALMMLTGDILLAATAAVAAQLISIGIFRGAVKKLMADSAYCNDELARVKTPSGTLNKEVKELFRQTILIFLSVFIDFYIFSAAKYAVDSYMTDEANGIFNILFMPTSVIYLTANFIIRPYMSRLSRIWDLRLMDDFDKVRRTLFMCIAFLSALGIVLTLLLGGPVLYVLELILGSDYSGMLTAMRYEFLLIIVGGCFYAMTNLYYYLLIIMRRQGLIFVNYLIMAAGAFIICRWAVPGYGMTGAAAGYAAYMLLLAIIFGITIKRQIGLARKTYDKEH